VFRWVGSCGGVWLNASSEAFIKTYTYIQSVRKCKPTRIDRRQAVIQQVDIAALVHGAGQGDAGLLPPLLFVSFVVGWFERISADGCNCLVVIGGFDAYL
jgi:hypothetical protein